MKKLITYCFLLLHAIVFRAQSGCTDNQAGNYNPSAITNDGSCTYSVSYQPFTLKVNTTSLGSNSGIEWINGSVYTFEDSGNPANFYKIDTITGSVLQTISVTNYPNIDWEDITADSAFVYMGDFGNNNGDRTDLRILKIKKSDFVGNTAAAITVTAQAIHFVYADQTNFANNSSTNFDCEAVLNIGDSLYIFTKDRGDLQTRVYSLPKTPGSYTVHPYASYNVNGKITGADYNPINKEAVLIGYMSGDKNSFIWYLSDFNGANFFSGNKRRVELHNNYAWQTEGICFYNETSTNRIFISNEVNGVQAGIYVSDVKQISDGIHEQTIRSAGISYMPDHTITASCSSEIKTVIIYDILGQQKELNDIEFITTDKITIKKKAEGPLSISILRIETASGEIYLNKIIN